MKQSIFLLPIILSCALSLVFISTSNAQTPLHYICYQTTGSITINGKIDEPDWQKAKWTNSFIDIEGIKKPKFDTKVKMLWNSHYLFIAAELNEPHIWANLTNRDDVIYRDNDFEIFIDPNGDNQFYYEIEINAFNTIMDLMMTKPYHAGGKYLLSMNFSDIKSAVNIDGTINTPKDIDNKWIIEIAIPLKPLCETLYKKQSPKTNDIWRINFSRVNWDTFVKNTKYIKKNLPEYNWVWSPQGVIDMHRPEKWGYLQFSTKKVGKENEIKINDSNIDLKNTLLNVYYKQKSHLKIHGFYTKTIRDLQIKKSSKYNIILETTTEQFIAFIIGDNGNTWYIDQNCKLWSK